MTDYSEKKIKAVVKEGGKKGQDLAGMADMGCLFQQAQLSEPEGNMDLLEKAFDAMNTKVDPEAEERKGGAGEVAKILLSANDDKFACIVHVPEQYTDATKNERQYAISAADWAEAAFASLPGDGAGADYSVKSATLCKITYVKDTEKGRYPGKAKDAVSGASFGFLRSKSLVVDDDSDDDVCYGDDDMPGMQTSCHGSMGAISGTVLCSAAGEEIKLWQQDTFREASVQRLTVASLSTTNEL